MEQCYSCEVVALPSAFIGCNVCAKKICVLCFNVCDKCLENVCDKCFIYCHDGDNEPAVLCDLCETTKYNVCEECDTIISKKIAPCHDCSAIVCKKCQNTCMKCLKTFCNHCLHLDGSPTCKGYCSDCITF